MNENEQTNIPVCRCCGHPFSEERPLSLGNSNMCVPCVTFADLVPAPPTAAEHGAYPEGRWDKKGGS